MLHFGISFNRQLISGDWWSNPAPSNQSSDQPKANPPHNKSSCPMKEKTAGNNKFQVANLHRFDDQTLQKLDSSGPTNIAQWQKQSNVRIDMIY